MEINGRTNDSVFIVRVEWKGRISFSLNLVCMEKFYASLTGIENTRRGGECVIDLGEMSLLSGPARYVTKITRIAMETWSLNAPWIFVWIESYESSFEPDR